MYRHPAQNIPRTPALARYGVTASAVALLLAGFAGAAQAQEGPDAPLPEESGAEDAATPAEDADAGEEAEDAEDADEHYEVVRGDSLSAIAGEHGLDPIEGWRLLFDANPEVAEPDLIVPGQVLRIPDPGEELEARELPAAPAPAVGGTAAATPAPQQSTPPSAPAPAPQPEAATSAPAGVWDRLAQCESGGNWQANTGNGYYGGLQFLPATWQSVGGAGMPHQASRDEQIHRAQILQSRSGWGQWPACSRQLGLR